MLIHYRPHASYMRIREGTHHKNDIVTGHIMNVSLKYKFVMGHAICKVTRKDTQ